MEISKNNEDIFQAFSISKNIKQIRRLKEVAGYNFQNISAETGMSIFCKYIISEEAGQTSGYRHKDRFCKFHSLLWWSS